MKKIYLRSTIIVVTAMFIFSLIGINGYSQIKKEKKNYTVEFNQTRNNEMNLTFTLGDYAITKKESSGVTYSYIKSEFGVQTMDKGYAELPMLSASVQLTPDKNVSMEVIYGTYEDINLDYPLLPSKGNLTRAVDPATIPYEIAPASIVDAWYPVSLATTVDPFSIRNVRGTNVYVYPMQYNAVKKILRVYNTINVKLTENNTTPVNPLTSISKTEVNEALDMYKNVFINFDKTKTNWTNEVGEAGDILVITTSTYASAVQPYIDWKKQMGYNVTMETVTKGTDVTTTIKDAYTANTKLFYVLLVGDYADVKSPTISYNQTTGATDPMLGCVVGTDNNIDICVGRFSVSSTTDVTTQVNKTINYEKTPTVGGTWYKKSLTIGSPASNGQGDDSEYDYAHVANIYNKKLSKFTYTSNATLLESNSASDVSTAINGGVSIANYCGHGDYNLWVSTNYSNTNVNSLTNGDKLPFIFSVACLNGNFNGSSICFAEAWLRKSGGGAVAALMSSVSQDWNQPMAGQDYMNDMVVGGHTYTSPESGTNTDHGKTHFGSIVVNGGALAYSEMSSYLGTMKTWTVFGDPALQIRTDTPKDITLSNEVVYSGSNTYNVKVNGTNFKDALVSIWDGKNNPISGLTDASGNVTLNNTIAFGSAAKLTVTGYNLYTFTKDLTVTSHTALPTENTFSNTVKVSPNPASEQVKISIDNAINGTYNVEIMNLAGQVVLSKVFEKNSTYFTQEIDLSNLTKGAYLVKFSNNENIGFQKLLLN